MRAVIYARYSSAMQREESIEAQVRACTEYIHKQSGWVLMAEYADRAFSARSDQRPEFQRMIKDAKLHKFDVLVIHKLDRFSRDRYDHAFYKRELRQAGVTLVSVLENLDDSPESVVLESVLEGFSEYYSRNLGREVMKGLKETALMCKHTGGIPPLGYDIDKEGKYTINEQEAEAVRYVFEAYINGEGYGKIVDWLKEHGIKGKQGKAALAKSSIHDIISNEKYTGVYIYNRSVAKDAYGRRNGHANKQNEDIVRIEGGMPAIISQDTFEQARKKMRNNRSGKHRAAEPYLLSGILFCGKCGGAYVGSSRGKPRTPTEVVRKYYGCSAKKQARTCDAPNINRDEIEDAVITYLESLLTGENVDEIVSWISENTKLLRKNSDTEIKAMKKELASVTKDANTILDKILNGLDSDTARKRLEEAESRKLYLEVKITDLQTLSQTITDVPKPAIRGYLKQLSGLRKQNREEQAKIIKQFVERIDVYPQEDGPNTDKQKTLKIKTRLDRLLTSARIETDALRLHQQMEARSDTIWSGFLLCPATENRIKPAFSVPLRFITWVKISKYLSNKNYDIKPKIITVIIFSLYPGHRP